jgi:uncharacterized protein (DUF58 family)
MRCMSCGAEMRLLQTERDDTMGAPGYQRRTLQCSGCNEIERRTIFTGEKSSQPDELALTAAPALEPTTPSVAPLERAMTVASIVSDAEEDLDEGEAMLRRAIAMVRGPTRSEVALTGIAPPKKTSPSRVVRIRRDNKQEPTYVAADAQSGLAVLRHPDSARLRAMCDRLGWQVIDMEADAPL